MQHHQCGLYCSEIITCLGVSNGSMPVWFRESLKSAVVKKANEKRAAETVRTPAELYKHVIVDLSVLLLSG